MGKKKKENKPHLGISCAYIPMNPDTNINASNSYKPNEFKDLSI